MNKFSETENRFKKIDYKSKNDAKRSLNNYIGQLKIHFELDEDDIIQIMENILKLRKNERLIKKWWHIWK